MLLSMLIYAVLALAVTSMVPYGTLSKTAPVAGAFEDRHQTVTVIVVSVTAVVGLLAGVLLNLLAGARLWLSLASEGYLPATLSAIDERTGAPRNATLVVMILSTLLALLVPFEHLAALVAAGTLFAFTIVGISLAALKMREAG